MAHWRVALVLPPVLLVLATVVLLNVCVSADLSAVDKWLVDNAQANLDRLIEFVSIPSVSSDPARADEVRRAADWLKSDLTSAGLQNVRILETRGHPSVYADWLHADDAPTVLIYGHFDVQPEDPINLWTTPPFEPTVRDGRLYARGASDDKGHMYVPVVAIRAYLETVKRLPVNVKLLLEGEEEVGSPNLRELLQKHSGLLAADYAFSADGGQVSTDIPGLCLGLRGSMSIQVTLRTADRDVHSGSFGGGVQNPLHAMAALVSSIRDVRTGEIFVDGFLDDVDDLTQEERDDFADFPLSTDVLLNRQGINETTGERGFTFLERVWARPSIDVVGMWGGFQGEGIKTVLPREAHAKISCRFVSSQKPRKAREQLKAHLLKEAGKIPGVSIEVKDFPFEADPFKMEKRTAGNRAATEVLTAAYSRSPVFFRMGGSIPVFHYLRKMLGLETTMFAFGNSDENVHSPDEFARIDGFRRGEKAYVRLFEKLAEVGQKEEL